MCATLYKNDVVRDNCIIFDTQVKNNEDGLFNFEYALNAETLSVIDKDVYYYRQYGTSSSSKRSQYYDYNSQIVERLNKLSWDQDANNFSRQLKTRAVSLALWDILLYTKSMSYKEGVNFISKRVNDAEVREGIKYIRFNSLSIYKKVFAYLIRYRLSLLLYLIVRHIYPFLRTRLRR